jgi:hypothetical protein
MPHPSLRTVAPPPCLQLDIKDSLKEDRVFGWWAACKNDAAAAAAATGCCVSASLRTQTLKGTWDSASLRKEILKNRKEERL